MPRRPYCICGVPALALVLGVVGLWTVRGYRPPPKLNSENLTGMMGARTLRAELREGEARTATVPRCQGLALTSKLGALAAIGAIVLLLAP